MEYLEDMHSVQARQDCVWTEVSFSEEWDVQNKPRKM